MSQRIEDPTIEPGYHQGSTITSHPAFAQIRASRISGTTHLYGSDFNHQYYVRVSISPSQLHRSLSEDNAMASLQTLIEVDMSEAQWAQFVSSMNTGGGTQATLRKLKDEDIPDLPRPKRTDDQFKAEAARACERAFEAVGELEAMIAAAKLSEKAKAELSNKAHQVTRRLNESLPFVLKQFGEHMETTVEKAKTEINAYVVATAMRTGLAALANGAAAGTAPLTLASD